MSYDVERRQSPRKRFGSLLYVELERGNGGLVLNFSEHGFGFRAAKKVRPKQEVQFAFNLDAKRRLEGRGRLEWTDDDGRLAGVQFTDVSEDFRTEIRNWLVTASPYAGKSSPDSEKTPAASIASHETKSVENSAGRSSATGKSANDKQPASINAAESHRPTKEAVSANAVPQEPATPHSTPFSQLEQVAGGDSVETGAPRNPRVEHGLPWAASLPPAVGLERKPSRPAQELPAPTDISASSAFSQTQPTASSSYEEDISSEVEEALERQHESPLTLGSISGSGVAAMEAPTVGSFNEHAQALLQHFQEEQERGLAAFRESTTRVLRDAERRLFPIREAMHAQISNLECSVTAATATAKALDQYPGLLEKAQQQALDRFQSQLQEVLRIHVTELRRRSEAILESLTTQLPPAASPKRISASSGIVITAIIIMALAMLFMFRREVAGGLIWVGQQLVESAPPPQAPEATPPVTKPKAEEQGPAPVGGAEAAPAPGAAAEQAPGQSDSPTPATSTKSVKAMWDDVAKGDVATELALGNMYLTGHGVTKNCFQARRLFAAAARKGSEEGQQKLAQVDRSCSN